MTVDRSFDDVLPIAVVPYRPYDDGGSQPMLAGPISAQPAGDSPITAGLDFTTAPPLLAAHYGKPKSGATVIAQAKTGEPIWVAADVGKGRSLWTGGVFANDEMSGNFSAWPQMGKFYVQTLHWLASHSTAPQLAPVSTMAAGTVDVDFSKAGPTLSAKHFGVHGQETGGGFGAMTGDEFKLYQALNPDGMFVRTSAFTAIKRTDRQPALPERRHGPDDVRSVEVRLPRCRRDACRHPAAQGRAYLSLLAALDDDRCSARPGDLHEVFRGQHRTHQRRMPEPTTLPA